MEDETDETDETEKLQAITPVIAWIVAWSISVAFANENN
jgi:hypothetical protein